VLVGNNLTFGTKYVSTLQDWSQTNTGPISDRVGLHHHLSKSCCRIYFQCQNEPIALTFPSPTGNDGFHGKWQDKHHLTSMEAILSSNRNHQNNFRPTNYDSPPLMSRDLIYGRPLTDSDQLLPVESAKACFWIRRLHQCASQSLLPYQVEKAEIHFDSPKKLFGVHQVGAQLPGQMQIRSHKTNLPAHKFCTTKHKALAVLHDMIRRNFKEKMPFPRPPPTPPELTELGPI
jgi:hypothetical protein